MKVVNVRLQSMFVPYVIAKLVVPSSSAMFTDDCSDIVPIKAENVNKAAPLR